MKYEKNWRRVLLVLGVLLVSSPFLYASSGKENQDVFENENTYVLERYGATFATAAAGELVLTPAEQRFRSLNRDCAETLRTLT